MKKTTLTIATLLLSGLLIAQDYTPPKTASDAFKSKHPKAIVDEWVDFDTEIICYFEENGKFGSAFFTLKGAWIRTEFNLSETELPQVVSRELFAKYKGYEIMDVTNEITSKGSVYKIYIYNEEVEKDFIITMDQGGKIISEEVVTTEDDSFE